MFILCGYYGRDVTNGRKSHPASDIYVITLEEILEAIERYLTFSVRRINPNPDMLSKLIRIYDNPSFSILGFFVFTLYIFICHFTV